MKRQVFVACVSHRHGANTYASMTQDSLNQQLAEYVRENWLEDEPMPKGISPEALTAQYFELCAQRQSDPDCLECFDSIEIDDSKLASLNQLIRSAEEQDAALKEAGRPPDGADYKDLMGWIQSMRRELTAVT